MITREASKSAEKYIEVDDISSQDDNAIPSSSSSLASPTYVQPAPFPQRLAKARIEKRYGKFLQMVKD